jgi:hypothetical protein
MSPAGHLDRRVTAGFSCISLAGTRSAPMERDVNVPLRKISVEPTDASGTSAAARA